MAAKEKDAKKGLGSGTGTGNPKAQGVDIKTAVNKYPEILYGITFALSEKAEGRPKILTKTNAWPYAGRRTDNGDYGPCSAWCNEKGLWGMECTISNHSIWCHNYKAGVDFGTITNGQFVVIEHIETGVVNLCGHHAEDIARGNGTSDNIQKNYAAITHARGIWCYELN